VLRQAPDVVLLGEMRDLETISSALTVAETGHLTFGTLHTNSAPEAVNRVIDVFPPGQQGQVRTQLAMTLELVVTQQLVPRADGDGYVLASEIMVATSAVRQAIRSDKVHQIPSMMQTGRGQGMQTMDGALIDLYRDGAIDHDTCLEHAHDREEMRRRL
jgi:twitching motility protein PilT